MPFCVLTIGRRTMAFFISSYSVCIYMYFYVFLLWIIYEHDEDHFRMPDHNKFDHSHFERYSILIIYFLPFYFVDMYWIHLREMSNVRNPEDLWVLSPIDVSLSYRLPRWWDRTMFPNQQLPPLYPGSLPPTSGQTWPLKQELAGIHFE